MARKFGISTEIPPYPSIHIGAADIFPIELIAAYTAFANLGIRTAPHGILRVSDAQGRVLWEPEPVRAPIMSPEEAWLMVDMLRDVTTRGTAAGAVAGAGFRIPAGGKTGTTNEGADVWFVGFTADLVAGVWMGMDRPQKIKSNAQGGQLAAPAWTAFMTEVYRRRPTPPDWPRPEAIITRNIDRSTGLLANPFCPSEMLFSEVFIPGTEPIRECDVHSPFTMPPDSLAPGDTAAGGTIFAPQPVQPGGVVPPSNNPSRVIPGTAPIPQPSRPDPSRPGRTPIAEPGRPVQPATRPPATRPPADTNNPFALPPR